MMTPKQDVITAGVWVFIMTDSSSVIAIGASVANKTTYTGAATGVLGWVTQIDLLSAMGVILAIIGFLFNLWFQYRRDKREEIESAARLRIIEKQNQVDKHE